METLEINIKTTLEILKNNDDTLGFASICSGSGMGEIAADICKTVWTYRNLGGHEKAPTSIKIGLGIGRGCFVFFLARISPKNAVKEKQITFRLLSLLFPAVPAVGAKVDV